MSRAGGGARRVAAIVASDLRARLRRSSTVLLLILLGFFASLWLPDPRSGRALLVIGGQRAIANAPAVAMATAMLASLFVGLGGFYVVSSAVRKDLETRTGILLASTPLGNGEYLLGKFLGNVSFLALFTAAFALSSMAMVLVRGEAPLAPSTFLFHYLLIVPPVLTLVSALGLVFESLPWLAGRLGDVLYFFVWMAMTGLSVALTEPTTGTATASGAAAYLDFTGFGLVIHQLRALAPTGGISIGATSFDPARGATVFTGLAASPALWLSRLVLTLAPLLILALPALGFHRFDPARLRRSPATARDRRGRLAAVSGWIAGRLAALLPRPEAARGATLLSSALADARLSLVASRAAPLALVVAWTAALLVPAAVLGQVVLPASLAVLALAIADLSTRDRALGLDRLLYAAPRLRRGYAAFKLLSALVVAAVLLAPALARLLLSRPGGALQLVAGVLFLAAAATLCGIASANPKTFVVLFLTFLYLALDGAAHSPALDFAGLAGTAGAGITAAYAAAGLGLAVLAHLAHLVRLARA